MRAGDTVARMSGDEFVVLLPGAGRRAAIRVSEKIRDSLRPAFAVGGYELVATASIGISLFPEHGTSADALLKSADVAMYHAKLQGRDHHRLYVTAMDAGAAESLALEGALRRALESEALTLHYQPIVEVASGRIRAVEALIRWRHPQLGLVWPADFIPLAEVAGLIHPISSWVLRTVCQQAKAWHLNGHPDLVITVNLSARQFHKPDLASLVADILREAGLPPRFLELEITESYAVQDAPSALATLQELKRLGVRIAIDDFGAGYTSLAYLKRFPIDTLKIDGSLLREVDSDRKDAAVAAALISMAHNLGLQVVAEGIETEDQRAFLQAQGCDCIQGFLYSHPLPAEECEALLEENLHENRGPKDPQHTLAWSHR